MPSWTSVTDVTAVGTWWRRRSARPGAQTRSVTSATDAVLVELERPRPGGDGLLGSREDAFERGVRERRLDVLPELRHGQEAHQARYARRSPAPRTAARWRAMDLATLAALVYLAATLVVVGFQLALALGAPWGAYAMGGRFPGRFPPSMRLLAVVQAVVLGLLALVVLASAGLISIGLTEWPWLIWLAVAVSAVSVVMNAASRSPAERRLWVPVGLVMLASSLVVALAG